MIQQIFRMVDRVRIGIYVAILVIGLVIGTKCLLHANEPDEIKAWLPGGLWPPDIIPHPHVPDPSPEDDLA